MTRITALFVFCLLFSCFMVTSPTLMAADRNSNPNISAEQIRQAAENGDPDAQYALGYMYYYGKGGLQRNVNEAKRWIGKAADNKQAQAIRAQKLMMAAEQKNRMNQNQASNNESAPQNSSEPTQNNAVRTNKNFVAHNEAIQGHVNRINSAAVTSQREKEIENEAAREVTHQSSEETLVESKPTTIATAMNSSEKRLLAVPSDFYTVQLMAGENKDAVDRMLLKNDLKPKAAVYHTYRNAKLMYVLIYGQYKTKNEAKVAATQLQKKLKLEPWIKSYASVKKSIAAQ